MKAVSSDHLVVNKFGTYYAIIVGEPLISTFGECHIVTRATTEALMVEGGV